MATPNRTGSYTEIRSNSATLSQSITVPTDAQVAVIFVTGDSFNGSDPSVSIGGQPATRLQLLSYGGYYYKATFTLVSPPTGSQTYTLSNFGTNTGGEGVIHSIGFYKDVDLTGTVVDSDSAEGGSLGQTITTPSMTCTAGDLAIVGVYSSAIDANAGVSGQTEVYDSSAAYNGTMSAAGELVATGSTITVSGYGDYPQITALVLKQGSAAPTITQHSFRFVNDDGDEDASTFAAALNTNVTLTSGAVTRLRVLIDALGDPTGKQFQLEYRHKPSGGLFGAWSKVS